MFFRSAQKEICLPSFIRIFALNPNGSLVCSALKVFGEVDNTLNKRTFRECIDAIIKSFPEEDVFDSLIHFLTTSVEVSF